jgi:hypothetical protein
VVLVIEAHQIRTDKVGSELTVGGGDGHQLTARHLDRRATFVDKDMCGIGTQDGVIGTSDGLESYDIAACAIEYEIGVALGSERFTNLSNGLTCPWIVAIAHSMVGIRLGERFHDKWMDARIVV